MDKNLFVVVVFVVVVVIFVVVVVIFVVVFVFFVVIVVFVVVVFVVVKVWASEKVVVVFVGNRVDSFTQPVHCLSGGL